MPKSRQTIAFPLTISDRVAIWHFRKSLPGSSKSDFEVGLELIMEAEKSNCSDQQTQSLFIFGASAISHYRQELRRGGDPETAKRQSAKLITTFGKRSSAFFMWLMQSFSRDTFEQVRNYTIEHVPARYGSSFEFGYDESTEGFTSIINKCGFHGLLERHGTLELLPFFCEWDRVWIDHLSQDIFFKRPSTIALGAETCRFEFRKCKSKLID